MGVTDKDTLEVQMRATGFVSFSQTGTSRLLSYWLLFLLTTTSVTPIVLLRVVA